MRPLLLALVALAVAAAGQPATAATSSKHAVVKTRHGALGTYLVDGRGRTLYLFRKDTGRRSRCAGACAQNWPPLITKERPEAAGGAKASLLSTSRRANGARQVLYNGHPLYRYIGDFAAGDTNGEGINAFGGLWWAVSRNGRAITSAATTPGY